MDIPRSRALIAIVDDDDSVRAALGRVARAAGYLVSAHSSGHALLESLGSSTPDCIVLDLNMPGLDGFGVHAELARRGYAIPVILITASDGPETERRAKALGASAFMRKPVESVALLAAIAAAIDA